MFLTINYLFPLKKNNNNNNNNKPYSTSCFSLYGIPRGSGWLTRVEKTITPTALCRVSLVRGGQFLPPGGGLSLRAPNVRTGNQCVRLCGSPLRQGMVDSSGGYTTSQSSLVSKFLAHGGIVLILTGQVWWVKHPVYARGRHGISDKPHTLFP